MTQLLELPQFLDQHGVAQMQVRRGGVKAGLDDQRPAAGQLVFHLFLNQQFDTAAFDDGHLFGNGSAHYLFLTIVNKVR